jgi:hypothetical protein
MALSFGFSGLNNNLNSADTSTNLGNQISELFSKTVSARVKDIILDDTHPEFINYGEWNGVGTIFFEIVDLQTGNPPEKPTALPLISYIKNYPLVNEIVYLIKLPNTNIGDDTNSESYYYLNTVNLWNHPHHNAYPNLLQDPELPPSQEKDYQAIEGGSVRRVTDNSTEINLNSPKVGGTFVEKSDIHPVLPFAGDNILEGRFGNSIRLGNTSKSKSVLYKNNWSGAGDNGDPITIIRNGQPLDSSLEGWLPIIENINRDLSSVYVTSFQAIPLTSPFTSFPSISTQQPESFGSYNNPQIILNSGRLILNTYSDSIFLNSNKAISFSSIEDIGLYSRENNINISGQNIRLGDTSANQSLVLGDRFMEQFNQFLESLNFLMDSLISEPTLGPSTLSAQGTKQNILNFQKQLDNFLSKTVKTL